MNILPDYDYADYNASIYGNSSKNKKSETQSRWYYPIVWFGILIIVLIAYGK